MCVSSLHPSSLPAVPVVFLWRDLPQSRFVEYAPFLLLLQCDDDDDDDDDDVWSVSLFGSSLSSGPCVNSGLSITVRCVLKSRLYSRVSLS